MVKRWVYCRVEVASSGRWEVGGEGWMELYLAEPQNRRGCKLPRKF